MNNFRIFGMDATEEYAKQISNFLDVNLTKHAEEYFADKEPYLRASDNVRGCDVYVVQSLYSDSIESVGDKFTKLLIFIGSLKDASADRVTAVIPYLGYSRQDRKTESREPITTKYVAMLLEAVGADRLLTMDVHNLAAFQNAFRIKVDNLEAKNLLADYVAANIRCPAEDLVVMSPDSGGGPRAKRFRNALAERLKGEIKLVYLDKTHTGRKIQGHAIIGDVSGKQVVIIDDMISSGSTIAECDKAIEKQGGKLWAACATHGLFVGQVNENLSSINKIVVTDTISPFRLNEQIRQKVHIISTTRMFGQAIRRTHDQGGSISDLLR